MSQAFHENKNIRKYETAKGMRKIERAVRKLWRSYSSAATVKVFPRLHFQHRTQLLYYFANGSFHDEKFKSSEFKI